MLNKKILLAGLLGNAIEWYDFILYAHFAPLIAHLFFPNQDPLTALLLTFGVFASGFLVRPIGALLFGYIGDHLGRRIALILSISLMSLPTLLISILPSYATIGAFAPVLLFILRLCQGIAVSGELNTATTFLVEFAAKNRRGLAGSLVMMSAFFGIFIGALLAASFSWALPATSLDAWGWRLLFALGGFAGLIGLYLRLKMQESPAFMDESVTEKRLPFSYLYRHYPKKLILAFALTSVMAVGNYIFLAYITTFLINFNRLSVSQAHIINLLSLTLVLLLLPVMGHCSDRWGRKKVFKLGLYGVIFCGLPIFWLLSQKQFYPALFASLWLSLLLAPIAALIPTLLAELFPTKVRNSGSAISYNMAAALFGGTAPLISLELVHLSGSNLAPAIYLIVVAVFALFALRFVPESYNCPLR